MLHGGELDLGCLEQVLVGLGGDGVAAQVVDLIGVSAEVAIQPSEVVCDLLASLAAAHAHSDSGSVPSRLLLSATCL